MYRWIYQNNGLWTSPEPVSDFNTNNFLTTGLGVFSPKVTDADAENNFVVSWQDRVSAGNAPLSRVSARRFHDRLSGWRNTVVVGDSDNQMVTVTLGAPGNGTVVVGAMSGQALQAASLR
jgi:hypothetical protein